MCHNLRTDLLQTLLSESRETNTNEKPVDFEITFIKLFSASGETGKHSLLNLMFYSYFPIPAAKKKKKNSFQVSLLALCKRLPLLLSTERPVLKTIRQNLQ